MHALRILLADDHALFRDGMASLLRAWNLDLVGEAADGLEAVSRVREVRPDVVLMDIQMPRMSGIQATKLIKEEAPDTKIVMLTMSEGEEDLLEAIKAGADGYLLKNLSGAELVAMLHGIARGDVTVSPSLAGMLLSAFARSVRTPPVAPSAPVLSERERDVLQLVARGATSRQVARDLVISENTVNFHVRNILDKLHARTRSEAVARAIRDGLVDPDAKD